MLRRRLITALDSPLSLVIVESIPGSGKRTLLRDWAAQSSDEHRALVTLDSSVSAPQLIQLVWTALRSQTYLHMPPPPVSYDEMRTMVAEYIDRSHRPIIVAIDNADHLDGEILDQMLSVVEVDPNIRLIVAAFDAHALIVAAQAKGVAFVHIDDGDLAFTHDETRELMVEMGVDPIQGSVACVQKATGGHAGMTAGVLATNPQECRLGTIKREHALDLFLTSLRPDLWPARISNVVLTLAHVPRFAITTAAAILGEQVTPSDVHRLQAIGLGRMSFSEEVRRRVFEWDESVRQAVLQFTGEFVPSDPGLPDRVIDAARSIGDHSLETAMLVSSGRLDEAEEVCARWLWDILPDSFQPIWQALYSIAPSALMGHPGLLCVRQRIATRGTSFLSPARSLSVARQILEQAPRDPWQRLSALARAADFARQGRIPGMGGEIIDRAKGLVTDLLENDQLDDVAVGLVSDLLVLAQACLQLGNSVAAGWFAQHAVTMIGEDPSRLDPHGTREDFGVRVMIYSAREQGLDDPVVPTVYLNGRHQFRRDANVVSSRLAVVWEEIDEGRPMGADSQLRVAMDNVRDPSQWPGLLFMQVAELALLQKGEELRELIRRYSVPVQATASKAGQSSPEGPVWPLIHTMIARSLMSGGAAPDFTLPSVWTETDVWAMETPRVVHGMHLYSALLALRAGRETEARLHLERAIRTMPKRSLAPIVLALATRDEIRRLDEIIKDHPGGPRLRLEMAMVFAAQPIAVSVPLSEREREVLGYLRQGMSNREIAEAMFVSVNTVKFHRANLLRKLDAKNRDEAINAAASLGL